MGSHAGSYQIMDEPRPGALARLTVDPFWVFMGMMLGGAWLGWPWWILNSMAIGSATLRKEIAIVVAGILTSAAMAAGFIHFFATGDIPPQAVPYFMIVLPGVKLGFAYWIHLMQGRSFALYQYFGGPVRKGTLPLIAGFMVRAAVLATGDSLFWKLVLV